MTTRDSSKAWDFSPVHELANALSFFDVTQHKREHISTASPSLAPTAAVQHDGRDEVGQRDGDGDRVGLGDFAKLWRFLGISPVDAESQEKESQGDKSRDGVFTRKIDYASDGAVRYGSRSNDRKRVTWRDDNTSIDGDVAPSSSPDRGAASESAAAKLTKSQRKKKNKRERKAREKSASSAWAVSESETDSAYLQTPARKASVHAPTHSQGVQSRTSDGRASIANSAIHSSDTSSKKRLDSTMRQASQPELASARESHQPHPPTKPAKSTPWPVTPQSKVAASNFLPSSVTPRPAAKQSQTFASSLFPDQTGDAVKAVQLARSQLQNGAPSSSNGLSLTQRPAIIEPKTVRSGEDRHWALLLKLINEFGQDRRHLVSPMNMTTHNNDPAGIHVFVDASNIFIGFNDQLKHSRGIPLNVRVPPVNLSFDALALLMERRRPIAKRTLVGSTPHLPAFDKAKDVGYECSILEKVYKARELTDRQIYFRDRDSREMRAKARLSTTSISHHDAAAAAGYSSGGDYASSDTGGAAEKQFAPARMIEQGVDELLHMKMAQSLLDYDTPATMVVATGDAAQAEYSDGFKAMIERALRKGWTVELVSWSKNISSLYLRRDFRAMWQHRFRVIYLDDYAEELLDM